MKELSVVIVSYNVRYFLEQCLHSVYRATEKTDCEIIVVDNNSVDGSCSMITNKFPQVRLIMNKENRGFAAANNQALQFASGRYIVLLNPDTIVHEDTFVNCIRFMDTHPDAGATGVRMINGKGKYLPESKRGLPSPRTAFFKTFGLASLFPRSGFFNNYYLGHLDSMKTAKVDVLTGAFMFLRREAVIRTGLLDESFFMYGEDIDYSYRITQAGFTIYYYPETSIIHYKGESAKKENNMYQVAHFYQAMIIFVKKYFSSGKTKFFILFLQLAIYFRASLSFLRRLVKKLFLPLSDGIIIYLTYRITTAIWQNSLTAGSVALPDTFTRLILPSCTLILLISITCASGYRLPSGITKLLKGMLTGIIIILIIQAFLPVKLFFPKIIVTGGGLIAIVPVVIWHLILSFTGSEIADIPFVRLRKTIIISDKKGYHKISALLSPCNSDERIAGRVNVNHDDMSEEVLGTITQIREIIRINRIRETVISASALPASRIIETIQLLSDLNIKIKIASVESDYIIGSRYVDTGYDVKKFKKSCFKIKVSETFLKIFR
ncbi:MAG TPA: glycosyltransferase [Bacteroidales bacterium]|nr:glycosyltransferase [Bacteroidales bacterium]